MAKLKSKFGEKIRIHTSDGRSVTFIVERIEDDDGDNITVEVLPDEDSDNREITVKLKENEDCKTLTIKIIRNEDSVSERFSEDMESEEINVTDVKLSDCNYDLSTEVSKEVDDPEAGQSNCSQASNGCELSITKSERLEGEHFEHEDNDFKIFTESVEGEQIEVTNDGTSCDDTLLADVKQEVKQEVVEPEEDLTDRPSLALSNGISVIAPNTRRAEKEMNVKNYVCKYCGAVLKSRSGLNEHERRHVGASPYKCCGKTYFSKANLSRHRCSVHGQEKAIKCSKCLYACATKGDLTRHEKIHQEPEFKCDICGVMHVTRTALRSHMDMHQDGKRHRCLKCGRTFRYSSGLSRHKIKCSENSKYGRLQHVADITMDNARPDISQSAEPQSSSCPTKAVTIEYSSSIENLLDMKVSELHAVEEQLQEDIDKLLDCSDPVDNDVSFFSASENESDIETSLKFDEFLRSNDSEADGSEDCTVEVDKVLSCDDSDSEECKVEKRAAVKEKEILRDLEYPDIYIRKNLKRSESSSGQAYKKKRDRVYNNYHCCFYCEQFWLHIPVHMKTHGNRQEVAEELKKDKPDFKPLRKMGDDKNNRKVVDQKKGELIIARKSNDELLDVSKYGPCINCHEWMLLAGLKKHFERCTKGGKNGIGKKDIVLKAQILAGHITGKPSKLMLEEVYRIMKDDDCTRTAQRDMLIVTLGESWLRRNYDNVEKRKYYCSSHMRLSARLLNALKAQSLEGEPSPATMWDFIVPSYFDNFVEASLSVSMPYMDDFDDLKAPSNALKLKYDIRRLVNAKWAYLLRENDVDSNKLKGCKRFLKLMEIEWDKRVTKVARTVLQTRHLMETKEILAPDDVEKLTNHLVSELQTTKQTPENYYRLVVLCQTRLLLFNKWCSGELEVLDLQSYFMRSNDVSDLDAYTSKDLTDVEKHLIESQGLVTITGKRGRPVPVMVPKDANKPLEYIANAEVRLAAGVQRSNKYLFANTANQYVRAYDSLKSICGEVSLKAPGRITSVSMRKYIATLTQLMGLDKHQLDWICSHLGHTKSVHNTAYRQMSGMVERVYISKLMMVQDLNLSRKFKGQNLEDLDVADLLTASNSYKQVADEEVACVDTDLPVEYNGGSDIETWGNKVSSEEMSEANSETEGPHPKKRKVVLSTRQKWSYKEVTEIKRFFSTYLEAGITPRQEAVRKALEKSKKEKGTLWMRKSHLIIKKISNMNKDKRK